MTTWAVSFKGKSPVGVVTENKRVVKAHPAVGVKEGMHIDKVIELVKKKHGKITRVK
jgi:hypothetical protein